MKPEESNDLAPAALLLIKFKSKLKSSLRSFRSLFKNEWTWRLLLVLQIFGFIGISFLALTNNDNWHLFPYKRWTDETVWDLFDSQFWTEYHENWFVAALLIGPFLITKATDWIFAARKKTPSRASWKNN